MKTKTTIIDARINETREFFDSVGQHPNSDFIEEYSILKLSEDILNISKKICTKSPTKQKLTILREFGVKGLRCLEPDCLSTYRNLLEFSGITTKLNTLLSSAEAAASLNYPCAENYYIKRFNSLSKAILPNEPNTEFKVDKSLIYEGLEHLGNNSIEPSFCK